MQDCDKQSYICGEIQSIFGEHLQPFKSECVPFACPIYKADDYEVRKTVILISFCMGVTLVLCRERA
jgi:hypothetical protein